MTCVLFLFHTAVTCVLSLSRLTRHVNCLQTLYTELRELSHRHRKWAWPQCHIGPDQLPHTPAVTNTTQATNKMCKTTTPTRGHHHNKIMVFKTRAEIRFGSRTHKRQSRGGTRSPQPRGARRSLPQKERTAAAAWPLSGWLMAVLASFPRSPPALHSSLAEVSITRLHCMPCAACLRHCCSRPRLHHQRKWYGVVGSAMGL